MGGGVGGVYLKKVCNYRQESIVLHLQMDICEGHFVKVLHYFNKFGLCTVFARNCLILFFTIWLMFLSKMNFIALKKFSAVCIYKIRCHILL